MIQISPDRKSVEFLSKWSPDAKKHLPSRILPMITGYVCPKCESILRAYFLAGGERFDTLAYEEQKGSDYIRQFSEFWTPSFEAGGISLRSHGARNSTSKAATCGLKVLTAPSLEVNARNLAEFLDSEFEPWWVEAIKLVPMEGLYLIADLCERDEPLLGIDVTAMNPPFDSTRETYDEFKLRSRDWKELWLTDLIERALMAGVKGVTI